MSIAYIEVPPGSASRGQTRTLTLEIKLTLVSLLLLMTLLIGRTAPGSLH